MQIGQTLSHFLLKDRIGSGGMGEVYLADDTQLGRKVALKFLSTRLADDPEFRARITLEAQAAYADSVTIPLRERFGKDMDFLGSAIFLSIALSLAGENAEAIAVGEKVVREWPRSRDAVESARALANLAFIYALAGEKERACATLADVLSRPSPTSPELLRLSPFFASLRDDPRFVAALETKMTYE